MGRPVPVSFFVVGAMGFAGGAATALAFDTHMPVVFGPIAAFGVVTTILWVRFSGWTNAFMPAPDAVTVNGRVVRRELLDDEGFTWAVIEYRTLDGSVHEYQVRMAGAVRGEPDNVTVSYDPRHPERVRDPQWRRLYAPLLFALPVWTGAVGMGLAHLWLAFLGVERIATG